MKQIKLLSVRQPWAWALIHGGKDVENRSWSTSYRGLLAIHAGLRFDDDFGWNINAAREMTDCGDQDDYHDSRFDLFTDEVDQRGKIIGVIELWGCKPGESVDSPWSVQETASFAWLVRNPVALKEPIPFKGQLGLGRIEEPLRSVLIERWEEEHCAGKMPLDPNWRGW